MHVAGFRRELEVVHLQPPVAGPGGDDHRPGGGLASVCGNDRMALGVYFALLEQGLSIPGDVSVIGYDDQEELAAGMHPALTTIGLPDYEMGRLAVERS